MPTPETIIPYGFCHCGCGQKTSLASQTHRAYGHIKGEPIVFIHGHNARGIKRSPETSAKQVLRIRHGHARQSGPSPVWLVWAAMIQRCSDPNCQAFPRYGGRGIKVCDRWRLFENFLADVGERPAGKSIDRYPNNDGNYEPGNVRWATWIEQQNNRRNNRLIEWRGESYTLANLSRMLGVPRTLISDRLKLGWSVEDAVCMPITPKGRYAFRER